MGMQRMNNRPAPTATRHQRGATLVEVLVSILLLSFTLLGIAGLMAATLRYQLGVESRSVITLLLNDTGNRLRVNLSQIAGFDASPYLYAASWASQQAAISPAPTDCGPGASVPCTGAQRAAYDLWEIRSTARRSLPQGSLQISGSTLAGLVVTFMWFDKDYTEHLSASAPASLRTSTTCGGNPATALQETCCPSAAGVSSTPGVRCLNFSFLP
jgi:type IV pilus assembly protein PilV